jgi:MYXO-CTERM domain-containing protein
VDIDAFNPMSAADLAEWDVIVQQWNSDSSIDISWDSKIAAYVAAGGGFYFDGDPNNRDDLASLVTASGGEDCSAPTTVGTVSGLTDGISGSFVNCHVSFDTWDTSILSAFLWDGSDVLGLYGDYGTGRIVLTGPDQDYHASKGSGGVAENQYNLLVNIINWLAVCADGDGDGYSGCDDCDDTDAAIYPGAADTWYDGIDSDCAGDSDYDADGDGDDHADYGGGDCNDEDASVHSGAEEACDWVDSDCDDSLVDEFEDMDGDGYPNCIDDDTDGDGVTAADDCDDWDSEIYPGAADTWYDGIDSDCAGDSDYDADGDGDDHADHGGGDCNDEDASFHSSAAEACDWVDSDCDGSIVDEHSDLDGDGTPDCVDEDADGDSYTAGDEDCDDLDASVYPGAADIWYDGIDSDCSGGSDFDADGDGDDHSAHGGGDCSDEDASIHSGAVESCDEVDSDCDGSLVDEFSDLDGDGAPDCIDDDDDGDGFSAADDCDDEDASIYPGAPETWYDGIDSDCGGDSDYDADGDGVDIPEDPDDTDPSITGDEDPPADDTGDVDTGLEDTGLEDTGLEDTGLEDTGDEEPLGEDTGLDDTGDGQPGGEDDADDTGGGPVDDLVDMPSKTDCSCAAGQVGSSWLLMVLGLLGVARRRRA